MNPIRPLIFILFATFVLSACGPSGDPAVDHQQTEKTGTVVGAQFSEDSAYAFVATQVAFGPRVPGTQAHIECARWLSAKLRAWADTLTMQTATLQAWDGTDLPMYNIIGRFNPDAGRRVLLCAHWDTRPIADQDTFAVDQPIDGANDGGSGVGVLLEIARQLHQNRPSVGVDIVLFDVEDYGNSSVTDSYCLGSQYWGDEARKSGYKADFGILLDMVGGSEATFSREGISMYFGEPIVEKVWNTAAKSGFSDYFLFNDEPFPQLTDDHLYVNRLTGIPTIDIIEYDQDMPKGFGPYWHTHSDNMNVIDKNTLEAVGQTLMNLLADNPI